MIYAITSFSKCKQFEEILFCEFYYQKKRKEKNEKKKEKHNSLRRINTDSKNRIRIKNS